MSVSGQCSIKNCGFSMPEPSKTSGRKPSKEAFHIFLLCRSSLVRCISRKKDGVSIGILHHREVHPERCSIRFSVALIPEIDQLRVLGRQGGLFLQVEFKDNGIAICCCAWLWSRLCIKVGIPAGWLGVEKECQPVAHLDLDMRLLF